METNGNTAGHSDGNCITWTFADLPPGLQKSFTRKITDGSAPLLTLEDFTFSYGPITYFSDKEDDMAGGVDEGEEEPCWQAYAEKVDELWRDAGTGADWVLYNY
jgi:hypothetical protein